MLLAMKCHLGFMVEQIFLKTKTRQFGATLLVFLSLSLRFTLSLSCRQSYYCRTKRHFIFVFVDKHNAGKRP